MSFASDESARHAGAPAPAIGLAASSDGEAPEQQPRRRQRDILSDSSDDDVPGGRASRILRDAGLALKSIDLWPDGRPPPKIYARWDQLLGLDDDERPSRAKFMQNFDESDDDEAALVPVTAPDSPESRRVPLYERPGWHPRTKSPVIAGVNLDGKNLEYWYGRAMGKGIPIQEDLEHFLSLRQTKVTKLSYPVPPIRCSKVNEGVFIWMLAMLAWICQSLTPGAAYNIARAAWGIIYMGDSKITSVADVDWAFRRKFPYRTGPPFRCNRIASNVIMSYISKEEYEEQSQSQ